MNHQLSKKQLYLFTKGDQKSRILPHIRHLQPWKVKDRFPEILKKSRLTGKGQGNSNYYSYSIAVTWLKYCQNGVKPKTINKSLILRRHINIVGKGMQNLTYTLHLSYGFKQ
jgi:hypothetical protein